MRRFMYNNDQEKRHWREHECSVIFIDSTYWTNSSKFGVFAVMASVLGAAVLIPYMFLQPGTQIDWNHDARREDLNEFLLCLKVRLANLKRNSFS